MCEATRRTASARGASLVLLLLSAALISSAALASAPPRSAALGAPPLELAPPSLPLERALASDEPSGFALGLVSLDAPPQRFAPLAGVEIVEDLALEPHQAAPPTLPETRIRAFDFLGQRVVGVFDGVNVELRWGCAEFSPGLASSNGEDPLGLESPEDAALRAKLAAELTAQQQNCPCIGAAPTPTERAEGQAMWDAYRRHVDESLFWVKATVVVPNAVAAVLAGKAGISARAGQRAAAANLPEYLPPRVSAPAYVAPSPARMPAPAQPELPKQGPLVVSNQLTNPANINFSQRTVNGNVDEYTADMAAGKWDWERSGPAHVMNVNGQLETYDNRRVMAAQNAGVTAIPIEVVDPKATMPGSKKTWEEAFHARRTDKRNIEAGGVVPPGGLKEQPTIATKKPKVGVGS